MVNNQPPLAPGRAVVRTKGTDGEGHRGACARGASPPPHPQAAPGVLGGWGWPPSKQAGTSPGASRARCPARRWAVRPASRNAASPSPRARLRSSGIAADKINKCRKRCSAACRAAGWAAADGRGHRPLASAARQTCRLPVTNGVRRRPQGGSEGWVLARPGLTLLAWRACGSRGPWITPSALSHPGTPANPLLCLPCSRPACLFLCVYPSPSPLCLCRSVSLPCARLHPEAPETWAAAALLCAPSRRRLMEREGETPLSSAGVWTKADLN